MIGQIFRLTVEVLTKDKKQDKVNYAVSERENRVTDVTTITLMTGCTGFQLGCTELK